MSLDPKWWHNLRFPVCAVIAVGLFGTALLAPIADRNAKLRQVCHDQQWELLEIEEHNLLRVQFLERLKTDPDLVRRLSRNEAALAQRQVQSINVPFELAIHPDAMLRVEEASGNIPSQAREQPDSQRTVIQSVIEKVSASYEIQKILLGLAVFFLICGTISLPRLLQTTRDQWSAKIVSGLRKRYLHHQKHTQPNAPHIESMKAKTSRRD
ncbi:hypothetical protein [Rubinisphaera italica]|uniref:Uncharacterized protein n=1 Tax=Rubinisphaera italica TaxID=2527969 RepID=A0A5C5XAA2_9PLAN|nr:hypothetical protein [Rubinisphaera italica]TWT59946.1 hypothetical protein Pan54_06570 [Rubinisphaera italica]